MNPPSCAVEMRSVDSDAAYELSEIQKNLKKLDADIERVNVTMDTLVAEKIRIEHRLSRFYENQSSDASCFCVIS